MKANEWQDTDVDDRQPQYCCYCGAEDAGFDGLDTSPNHVRVKCGECGHEFITVSPSAEVGR